MKVGCATRSLYVSLGPKAEGVPTNNQRGRGSGPCSLWGGLDKARHIVPTALLVRVQRLTNDLYKAVKGPSTRLIVLSMITGSYCRRRRRFTIFEPAEMKFDSLFKATNDRLLSKTKFLLCVNCDLPLAIWPWIKVMVLNSKELWAEHILVYVHRNLYLQDMTLGQGLDAFLGYRHNLCEILSKYNMVLISYGPDTSL